ncbi:ATP-grasp domain-containing protein [Cellulomonas sp. 179-A 9B4 NHS]|uniref:ATP-grasp domain-containing protein n=1 Tax=Cellulomonas sp. 179-A 9B4 NHS TaxID=3142379 RepID=UPI0039A24637
MTVPRSSPNVLISSAGRRNYLVSWFREATRRAGGRTVVADADPYAPARADADAFAALPPITSDEYGPAFAQVCAKHEIGLAISVNDHELAHWSTMDRTEIAAAGTLVLALDASAQRLAEDKLVMARELSSRGVPVPTTVSGADAGGAATDVVIKSRFGSGSDLIAFSAPTSAADEASRLSARARDRLNRRVDDPRAALDALVVQERKVGQEYGVDVVNDLDGEFVGVLARRKIRMRGGETDQAETVDPTRFVALARALSRTLRHRGLIDCDVIEAGDGSLWLIDVNPRFGGGYPFNHVAGADVPSLYLHWLTSTAPASHLLDYAPGVVASKHVDIAVVAR